MAILWPCGMSSTAVTVVLSHADGRALGDGVQGNDHVVVGVDLDSDAA